MTYEESVTEIRKASDELVSEYKKIPYKPSNLNNERLPNDSFAFLALFVTVLTAGALCFVGILLQAPIMLGVALTVAVLMALGFGYVDYKYMDDPKVIRRIKSKLQPKKFQRLEEIYAYMKHEYDYKLQTYERKAEEILLHTAPALKVVNDAIKPDTMAYEPGNGFMLVQADKNQWDRLNRAYGN